MRFLLRDLLVPALLVLLAGSVQAQKFESYSDLVDRLSGGTPSRETSLTRQFNGISNSGDVIIGPSWRLSEISGFELFPGDFFTSTLTGSLSDDGGTVGLIFIEPGPIVFDQLVTTAQVFTSGGGITTVGSPQNSVTTSVSGDGNVVFGIDGNRNQIFRSTANEGPSLTGITPMGGAVLANYDGTTVVHGNVRWDLDSGQSTFAPAGFVAAAISDSGSTIVGTSASGRSLIFDKGDSPIGERGFGSDNFEAKAISGSGSIVGGSLSGKATIWNRSTGFIDIETLLRDSHGLANVANWDLTEVNFIDMAGRRIAGSGINPSGRIESWTAEIPQVIHLRWGDNLPRTVIPNPHKIEGYVLLDLKEGSTPASGVGTGDDLSQFRREVQDEVQRLFDQVVDGAVLVTEKAMPGATEVFFINRIIGVNQGGHYFSNEVRGPDQFNQRLHDQVYVVVEGLEVERLAHVIAHEAGHSFGLHHVDPQQTPDSPDLLTQGEFDSEAVFNDIVSQVRHLVGPPAGFSHNPAAHLKRYVQGVRSSSALGDWETKPKELIELELKLDIQNGAPLNPDSNNSAPQNLGQTVLYDVWVLGGTLSNRVEDLALISSFDEITVNDLGRQKFLVEEGSFIQVVAASEQNGVLDLILSTGDPFSILDTAITVSSSENVTFQQITDSTNREFQDIVGVEFLTTPVPSIPVPSVLGDVNQDGLVDFADIPAFIDVLLGGDFQAEADCDQSGVVDFADIPAFIDILLAS